MLLCSRITSPRAIRFPSFTTSHRLNTIFKCSASAASAKVLHRVDEECNDFLPWLERKAGTKISSVLTIGKSTYGRSLFASGFIRNGDCMLRIPYDVQLGPDNLPPDISSAVGDKVSNVSKLALVILLEKKLGKDSEWDPYMRCLPDHGEMHSTIFWIDEELEMLQLSSVHHETIKRKAEIEREFLKIKLALREFQEIFEDVTLLDFKHAYVLVTSRAWESSRGVSLIPFADFLNHDSTSESDVLSDEDEKHSEVLSDRAYAPGDQVLIRYGKFSNSTLLLDFGFTLPCNSYDQVQFQVSIPENDHLFALKMGLLLRQRTPSIKDVNCFSSSWDSFTIKKVRSTYGKGRGIPQSVRAFARVLCSESSQELDDLVLEAAQNDGRLARSPLKNRSKEIQAHEFLLLKITELIQQYDAFIMTLNSLEHTRSKKFSTRRRLATMLLMGELQVLKSASAWLKNYCSTLSTMQWK